MNQRIRELLAKITALEDELQAALHVQENSYLYRLEGTRVRFENAVDMAHRRLKMGLLRWFRESRPQSVLSAPFIYSMIVPLVLLDLSLSIYQTLCFPLYNIPKVSRSNYVVIDRHRLSYLNIIEKINCVYCGYANGLIAYAREITARTEQYWCPIKHARRVVDSHRSYAEFLDFGDSQEYAARLEALRQSVSNENIPQKSEPPD